jgi:CBS domain-containing protein
MSAIAFFARVRPFETIAKAVARLARRRAKMPTEHFSHPLEREKVAERFINMSVAHILAKKGRCVVTVGTGRTLHEVAKELVLHNIGALVVVDANDHVVGLISERNVVEAFASRGIDAMFDSASSHMDTNPRFAHEDDSVDQTMETMTLERRRHLPVLRDGRLAGIVSIGDVVKYRIDAIEAERSELREYIATGGDGHRSSSATNRT